MALSRTSSAQSADEIAQEVLLRLWRSGPPSDALLAPEAWIVQITVNESARLLTREAQRRSREVSEERTTDLGGRPPASAVVPAEAFAREDVVSALTALSARDRTIVALRYFGDLPLADVADRLELPIGTVKAALSRAHRRLKESMHS